MGGPLGDIVGGVGKGAGDAVGGITGGLGDGVGKLGRGDVVGGGGAPEYPLPGFAVAVDESLAAALRAGTPAVLPRVHQGQCLVDVRCIPASEDETLIAAIRAAQESLAE